MIRWDIIDARNGQVLRRDTDKDLADEVCKKWNEEDQFMPGPQGPYVVLPHNPEKMA